MPTIKQLVMDGQDFYPVVHAGGIVFSDGSSLGSKEFANNSTITLTKGNWSDTFTTNASSNKTINLPNDTVDTSTLVSSAEFDSVNNRINFKNSLGTVISYVAIDITGKESTSNKVTAISSSSTDVQYPSAKCVYDEIDGIEDMIGDIDTVLDEIINGEDLS